MGSHGRAAPDAAPTGRPRLAPAAAPARPPGPAARTRTPFGRLTNWSDGYAGRVRRRATAPTPVPEDGPPRTRRRLGDALVALHHRNYALFWTGALISNIGTWMQNVTVPYVLLYVMHTSPVWVGVATASQFLPGVVLGPYAGAMADRFPRRTVILVCQAVMTVIALGMWAAWSSGVRSPVFYVATVGAIGLANGLNAPSWQAYVTELVPRADLFNAITLNSAQFNVARAIGPALTGLVLARFGPSMAFLLNGLSFVAVIVALLLITVPTKKPTGTPRPMLREFAEGLTYARRHTGILVAIAVATCVAFVALPVAQLATIMAKNVFNLDAAQFGILVGAYGAGAVVGAVGLGSLGSGVVRPSRLVVCGVMGFAAALALFGVAPVFWVAVIGLGACGVSFISTMAVLNTSIQLQVPEHLRGRVMAVYFMAFTGAYPLGSLLESWLAGQIGARLTLLLAATCMALLGVAMLTRRRWLVALDGHLVPGFRAGGAPPAPAAPPLRPVGDAAPPAPAAPPLRPVGSPALHPTPLAPPAAAWPGGDAPH